MTFTIGYEFGYFVLGGIVATAIWWSTAYVLMKIAPPTVHKYEGDPGVKLALAKAKAKEDQD